VAARCLKEEIAESEDREPDGGWVSGTPIRSCISDYWRCSSRIDRKAAMCTNQFKTATDRLIALVVGSIFLDRY